jgi:hypothetical protein
MSLKSLVGQFGSKRLGGRKRIVSPRELERKIHGAG